VAAETRSTAAATAPRQGVSTRAGKRSRHCKAGGSPRRKPKQSTHTQGTRPPGGPPARKEGRQATEERDSAGGWGKRGQPSTEPTPPTPPGARDATASNTAAGAAQGAHTEPAVATPEEEEKRSQAEEDEGLSECPLHKRCQRLGLHAPRQCKEQNCRQPDANALAFTSTVRPSAPPPSWAAHLDRGATSLGEAQDLEDDALEAVVPLEIFWASTSFRWIH
jgi:hypothetical protein